jgi:KaiC/GvpD/RAD55 family RecA-like ATPase
MSDVESWRQAIEAADEGVTLTPGAPIDGKPTPVQEVQASWTRYVGNDILDMKPRKWLVGGWLPLDAAVLLYSAPGVGKSFYALSLALQVANGGEWVGESLTEALPVLYVAAERPTDQRDRAEAWGLYYEEDLPKKFTLMEAARPPQLTNPLDVEAICQEVRDMGAKLVVLDTYARMTLGLEENSSSATSPVVEALDQIRKATDGGTVLIVHHQPKSGNTPRGSTALLGGVDMTILLTKSDTQVKATVEKANAGREPTPIYYALEPVLLPPEPGEEVWRDGAVMVAAAPPQVNPELAGLIVKMSLDSFPEGASISDFLSSLRLDLNKPKLSKAGVGRVLTSLHRDGKIRREGKGPATRYFPSSMP